MIPTASIPEIVEGPTATAVTVRFTRLSFTRLIDDLYDADPNEDHPGKALKEQENEGSHSVDRTWPPRNH